MCKTTHWRVKLYLFLLFSDVTVSDPLFDGISSFLSTRPVNVRHSMDVVISFKPLSENGLLFYAAQHLNELSRDFVSLSLVAGYVQLRFNLGTDPSSTVVLSSFQKIENSKFSIRIYIHIVFKGIVSYLLLS